MTGRVKLEGDLTISRIAYGLGRPADVPSDGPDALRARIEAALAEGITTIDQPDQCGNHQSPTALGAVVRAAPALRDKIEIVAKAGLIEAAGTPRRVCHYDLSPAHLTASVEASLRDLGTDRLDLLLLSRRDPLMRPADTGAALDRLVTEGKLRAVGVSNFRPFDTALLQSEMQTRLQVNQIELSLAAMDALENGDLAAIEQTRMIPMGWSPLAGGALLAGAEPDLLAAMREMAGALGCEISALAVAWLLAHPAGIVPVIGTTNVARIAELARAAQITLSRDQWFALYTAARGRELE
ncbi:MAG: aldo/keto reductase [Paracoccus sp. (in: a-proteobacteria)]|nr:aldo/keto reductase [Paracoccus sp. (in: a-proteobacteria)]